MILRQFNRISRLTSVTNVRECSYKPIKRPDFNSPKAKAVIDKKFKEFNLSQILKARIELSGPLTSKLLYKKHIDLELKIVYLVATYMKEILTSPHSGYYMSKDVFGQQGDFITSPEIGQIFGEMIAVWCLAEYRKIGAPKPLQIVEMGPGRGTLVQDIIRVFSQFDAMDSLSVHLVEVSPFLSKLQSQKLCFNSKEFDQPEIPFYRQGETVSGVKVYWYKRIEDVPNNFSIILAHEFFDALPIHKLQKDNDIWREILVDFDPENPDKFRYVISRAETPISKLFPILYPDEKRKHVEISPESDLIANHLADRLETYGGFGLIIDYGHEGDKEDTFRVIL
jgi:NADH dehydrogenase [ubiquinone] 1 alpha subcomplex assembly factor 7